MSDNPVRRSGHSPIRVEPGQSLTEVLTKHQFRAPWHRPELKRWCIVGMNHYHCGGERRLFVSMTWRGPGPYSITAEGPDGPEIWDELARQSVVAIGEQK